MIKTLVCISNYGDGQIHYLHRLLDQYNRMNRFETEIVLQTTTPVDLNRYSFRSSQMMFKPDIKFDLAMQHRRVMIDKQDDFDLFIYAENDILITEENLIAFCDSNEFLPHPYAAGFIRYEHFKGIQDDAEKYLPDAHPAGGSVFDGEISLSGRRCIRLTNRHQGCFVLTRAHLKQAIQSPHFNFYFPKDPLNREVGASFVYIGCSIQRVIPWEFVDRLMIHHLPDKYVNLNEPPWNETRPHTLTTLKALVTHEVRGSCNP
ncbi:MAG: hypothetical protein O2960_19215 [Verrucomicrobia bacterium]|nr:hypothetical protein [Verrucomicrobiota bacterium]